LHPANTGPHTGTDQAVTRSGDPPGCPGRRCSECPLTAGRLVGQL